MPCLFVSTIRATDNFIGIYVESSIVPHKPQETMFNVDVYVVLPACQHSLHGFAISSVCFCRNWQHSKVPCTGNSVTPKNRAGHLICIVTRIPTTWYEKMYTFSIKLYQNLAERLADKVLDLKPQPPSVQLSKLPPNLELSTSHMRTEGSSSLSRRIMRILRIFGDVRLLRFLSASSKNVCITWRFSSQIQEGRGRILAPWTVYSTNWERPPEQEISDCCGQFHRGLHAVTTCTTWGLEVGTNLILCHYPPHFIPHLFCSILVCLAIGLFSQSLIQKNIQWRAKVVAWGEA